MEQTSPADRQNVILDSHCHAWRLWPYPPLVPDENSRGTIEQVMHEMDMHGVEQAAVVCAGIENNRDNVEYVAFARDRYRGRIHILADLDCFWHATYHTPGSADRLRKLDDQYDLLGFTHYVTEHNDGWRPVRKRRPYSPWQPSEISSSAWRRAQPGRLTSASWHAGIRPSRCSATI